MNFSSWKKAMSLGLLAALAIACDKTDRSFSILAENTGFKQAVASKKVDILWVVDNSSSMQTSQANLAANFQSFINKFQTLGYDFHMSVISSDAYIGKFNVSNRSYFHDGSDYRAMLKDGKYEKQTDASNNPLCDAGGTPHICNFGTNPLDTYYVLPVTYSGVKVINKNTPDITNVFVTNATQGTQGSSEERTFESFKDALERPANSDFRRPDAFLAIIIVSDEDDWSAQNDLYKLPASYHTDPSRTGSNPYYSGPEMQPVSYFKSWLDSYAGVKNYSVNAITIDTEVCRASLNNFAQRLGVRHIDLATQTDGVVASLCGNFADSLSQISQRVLELSATYRLDRAPIIETISVTVDGVPLANDAANGWTYDPATQTIYFHGDGVPPAGANVLINYDPVGAKG